MIKLKDNNKVYKILLRNQYGHIKTEKELKILIQSGINNWMKKNPAVGLELNKKSTLELCREFGIITAKWEIKQ